MSSMTVLQLGDCEQPMGELSQGEGKELDLKLDILEHSESMKSREFSDWLGFVEKVFHYKDLTNHQRVKLGIFRFECKLSQIWFIGNFVRDHGGVFVHRQSEGDCNFVKKGLINN